jgi:uncharacterized protein (UPF0332 family)
VKEYTQKLLNKAADSIESAEILLEHNKVDAATGRAYYAMFYAAEAILNEKELRFSKHGNVHAAFGEHFAKTKILDPKYHRWLITAFDARQASDYGVDTNIEPRMASDVLNQAREFLDVVRAYLSNT